MERGTRAIGGLVELVRWPRDAERRLLLRRAGIPCLLLVDQDTLPPTPLALTEDWMFVPADERDLHARAWRLAHYIGRLDASAPVLADGVLHRGDHIVVLTASEQIVAASLLDAAGGVVGRHELEARLWPQGPPSDRALDDVVYRLRRRCTEVGLRIRAVRGRGFAAEVQAEGLPAVEVTA
jgi:hypothetical protein